MKGKTTMTFVYKLDDKPNKTSLKAMDIDSSFIIAAGGAWSYEENDGITKWTQINSLVLKNSGFLSLFSRIFKFLLQIQTQKAMNKVKFILENRK